jgi:uroporphyrinogen decarboxylase
MTKKERIDAILTGQPVDRIPVSFWRHFYEMEDTPGGLADAMLSYQNNYDWDFMKVNPRASYHHEDWGASYKFFKDGFTKPERLDCPVKKLSDLAEIKPLEPLKAPVLKDHLDAVHLISKGVPKNFYYIMTIFTPLSILGDMTTSRDKLLEYMQEDPKLVKQAIEAVTITFEKFTEELLNIGVSGLYFATTYWGSYDRMTDESFNEFSRPYDMRILNLVKDCPFNILHVCKSNNMLLKLADYPVHLLSWDATDPTNKNLWEGKEMTGKAVAGGIDHIKTLPKGTEADCMKQAEETAKKMGGKGWMMAPGCTYPPETPSANLVSLRKFVEEFKV